MQELLDIAWSDHYHIFDEMQEYIDKDDQELSEQIKIIKTEFLYSKTQVTTSMSQILDFVIKSSIEASKIKGDPELKKKRLAQFLSLRNGKKGKNYREKN